MSYRLGGAAALLLSSAFIVTNANAADLGGDCCADLEERVAELEATTARKGNRKVSLTVYGQVNTAVMFWDNGRESNTYVVDNDISSTRFGFKGKAKITPDWSAGYKIEIETQVGQSDDVNEDNPDADDPAPDFNIRKAEWFLQSKTYGKLSVGQGDFASSGITEIDLSGTNVIAQWDNIKFGSELAVGIRGTTATSGTYESFSNDGNHEFNRGNRVRYDTPTFAGFVASAAWGEDDAWDVALRYAGEFSGFKLAAGVSYMQSTDESGSLSNDNDCSDAANDGCEIQNVAGSVSVLHAATGLFVTGGYSYRDFDDVADNGANLFTDYVDNHWFVRGGIAQKFFALGKTSIYAEYQEYERVGQGTGGLNNNIDRVEEAEVIGAGIVQKIDAAAMELYLGYRHVTVDDNRFTNGTARDYHDLDVVTTGARIKF